MFKGNLVGRQKALLSGYDLITQHVKVPWQRGVVDPLSIQKRTVLDNLYLFLVSIQIWTDLHSDLYRRELTTVKAVSEVVSRGKENGVG